MANCKTCMHEQACAAWIRHGEMLYDDFEYSVEDCQYYTKAAHGRWMWEGQFKACSECGSYVEWSETLGANFWKYCPYCGIKMEEDNIDWRRNFSNE